MTTAQIAIIIGAAVVGALVKGITGMGYPMVLLPIVALFIDASEAVVLVSLSNLAVNVRLVRLGWAERAHTKTVKWFLISSVVGSLIGGFVLAFISDSVLRVVLIVVVLAFIASRLRAPDIRIPPHLADRWSIPVGGVAGVFQGAAGISGPIVTPWFMSLGLSRNTFVFSLALVFSASGLAQITAITIGGLLTVELATVGVVLIPIALVVTRVGVAFRQRLPQERFEQIVLGLLALSALGLASKLL